MIVTSESVVVMATPVASRKNSGALAILAVSTVGTGSAGIARLAVEAVLTGGAGVALRALRAGRALGAGGTCGTGGAGTGLEDARREVGRLQRVILDVRSS